MSDTLGIVLKVDATQAKPVVDDVEKSLAKVEARGPSVSQALSGAFRDGATAAEKFKQSTAGTTTPFDGLTAALKREQDALEKIQRPLKELAQGHEVLDSLMKQGRITAEQYTEQLEKLEVAAGKAPKEPTNPSEKLEGGIGFASGLLGGGVAAEAVEIGKQFAELANEGKRLADEYINLKNATLGFKQAGVSTDDTVGEMRDLAEDLQSKLPETINLYRRIDESADHLGLTHTQITEDVKAFGMAALASGHTLDDAAGAMGRLSIMMQSGTLDMRGLNSIIKTMPGIVKEWEAAFGEPWAKILQDIKEHKINIRELMIATASHTDVLKKQMDQREKTNELSKEEIIQGAKIFQQRHDVSFAEAMYAQKLNETELALAHNKDGTLKYVDALTVFDKVMKQVDRDVDDVKSGAMTDFIQKAGEFGVAVMSGVHDLGEMSTSLGGLMVAMGAMDDKWGTVTNSMAQKAQHALGALGLGMKEAADRGATEEELRNLDNAIASGARIIDAYERRKALVEKLGGAEQKFYDGIVAPMADYERHLRMLNEFWERGAISAKQYADELRKLGSTIGLTGSRGALGEGASFDTQQRFLARHGAATPELDVAAPDEPFRLPPPDPKAQQALELYDKTRTAAEKYSDERKQIDANEEISNEAKSRILADLDVKYGKVYTQAEQYAKALQDLDARTKVGLVSLEAHDVELDKLRMKYNQGDLGTGFREGMRQIEASINPAMDAQKLLVDGFNGVRDSITSLATTGTADFSKLVDTILADAARMAEDQLLKDLFKIGSSGGGSGGGNDVINALGLMVPGAADGGYVNIPHFAGGGMLTPMRSGRDDHLLQMFVNTGERVTVQNQQQLAAEARGGQGGPVAVENHNHMTFTGLDDRSIAAGMSSAHGQAATYKFIRDNAGAIRAILQRG